MTTNVIKWDSIYRLTSPFLLKACNIYRHWASTSQKRMWRVTPWWSYPTPWTSNPSQPAWTSVYRPYKTSPCFLTPRHVTMSSWSLWALKWVSGSEMSLWIYHSNINPTIGQTTALPGRHTQEGLNCGWTDWSGKSGTFGQDTPFQLEETSFWERTRMAF